MTTSELIEQVNASAGSIFTKDDVVALLNQVTTEKTGNLLLNDLCAKSIVDEIVVKATANFDEYDIVSEDNVDLSLDYNNRVTIDNLNVDDAALEELIKDAATEIIEDLLENLKANQITL